MKLAGLPAETVLACAADDTDRHKPDPAPLLMGLATLNASVAGSLYVGDAIFDLQAAAAAGMDGIGVTATTTQAMNSIAAMRSGSAEAGRSVGGMNPTTIGRCGG